MNSTALMKRSLKLAHTLAAIGLMGGLAAYLVIVATAPRDSLAAFLALRESLVVVAKWLILPSMLLTLVSGMLAMAVHPPFHNAGWVWAKLVSGVLIFEGTLSAVDTKARDTARLAAELAAGSGEGKEPLLEALLRGEWVGLWTMLALCLANVVLGVWRPKAKPRPRA